MQVYIRKCTASVHHGNMLWWLQIFSNTDFYVYTQTRTVKQEMDTVVHELKDYRRVQLRLVDIQKINKIDVHHIRFAALNSKLCSFRGCPRNDRSGFHQKQFSVCPIYYAVVQWVNVKWNSFYFVYLKPINAFYHGPAISSQHLFVLSFLLQHIHPSFLFFYKLLDKWPQNAVYS